MKQLFVIISILISLISVKCQNEANSAPKVVRRDTMNTVAAHMTYGLKGMTVGNVKRITADSMRWVGTDSTTMKRKWDKITYYEVIVSVRVDSALSRQFRVPIIDSLGNPNVINLRINAEDKYVVWPIYDLDSAYKHLKQYIDTTQKK